MGKESLIGDTQQIDTVLEMASVPSISSFSENILKGYFVYTVEVSVMKLPFSLILAFVHSGRIDLTNHFLVNT